MKKSLFMITLLAALGLAACGGSASSSVAPGSSTAPDSSAAPAPVVPTEDGKCTFFFKTTEASIELKEYESLWLTGGAFGWKTGYNALEMKALESDKTVHYAIVANDAFDVSASQGYEYQLVIGYNTAAKMPEASSGLQWVDGRKSDECAAPGGLSNLSFEYQPGQMTVDLGSHTFSTPLPKPAEPLKNYSFKVEFAEAVPEYGKVVIFGSFNGWQTPKGTEESKDADKALIDSLTMVPDSERKVFTLKFDTMVAGDYQCKILVEYVETAVYNVTWNAIDQTKENYAFSVTQADGDGYTLEILDEEATFSLPDPTVKIPLTVIAVNNGGELTAEQFGLAGSFNGWSINGNMFELVGEEYIYAYTDGVNGTIEFGIMANSDWSDKAVAVGGGNIAVEIDTTKAGVTVTISLDFSKLGVESQEIAAEAIVVEYID